MMFLHDWQPLLQPTAAIYAVRRRLLSNKIMVRRSIRCCNSGGIEATSVGRATARLRGF